MFFDPGPGTTTFAPAMNQVMPNWSADNISAGANT